MKSLADKWFCTTFPKPELKGVAQNCLLGCTHLDSDVLALVVGFIAFVFQMLTHHKGTPRAPLESALCLCPFSLMLLGLPVVQEVLPPSSRRRGLESWCLNSMFCRMILTMTWMLCWKRACVPPKRGEWRKNTEETVTIRPMERRVCSQ